MSMDKEAIKKDLEFSEAWFGDMFEGEPICQDEIDTVKELLGHLRGLLVENERLEIAAHVDISLGNTVAEMNKEIESLRAELNAQWNLNKIRSEELDESRRERDEARRELQEWAGLKVSHQMLIEARRGRDDAIALKNQVAGNALREIESLRAELDKLTAMNGVLSADVEMLECTVSGLVRERDEARQSLIGKVDVWECPDCGFAFDATHEDVGGGYSCPECEASKLRQANAALLEENDRMTKNRNDWKGIADDNNEQRINWKIKAEYLLEMLRSARNTVHELIDDYPGQLWTVSEIRGWKGGGESFLSECDDMLAQYDTAQPTALEEDGLDKLIRLSEKELGIGEDKSE